MRFNTLSTRPVLINEGYFSIRKAPINLALQDVLLFTSALQQEIKPTYLYSIHQANILRNTIFKVKGFRFFYFLTHLFPPKGISQFRNLKLFLKYPIKLDAAIWITDEWSLEYFHWLTDALTRLLAVASHVKTKTVVLPLQYESSHYVRDSLKMLGFEVCYIARDRRLLITNLFVSIHTAPTGNYNKQYLNDLRTAFCRGLSKGCNRKLYISRAEANKRKIINEESVREVLSTYGYETILFEKLSFFNQVEIMSQTRYLIGLHGAGLTNMLFMPSGGSVLELRNVNDSHNNCYFTMASELGHNYFYQTTQGLTVNTFDSDFFVDINKLTQTLEQMKINYPDPG